MLEFRLDNERIFMSRDGLNSSGSAAPFDLWAEIKGQLTFDIGFLPPGLKWISPARSTWLFQSPPRRQVIFYHHSYAAAVTSETPVQTYEIPLPWTVMVVEIGPTYVPSRTWVFATTAPLGSGPLAQQPIGALPLPNHYASGQICFPPSLPQRCQDVGEAVRLAHHLTFGSYSNADTRQNIVYAADNGSIPPAERTHRVDRFLKYWEDTDIQEVVETWRFPPPLDGFSYPEDLFSGRQVLHTVADLLNVISANEAAGRRGQLPFALQSAFSRASARNSQG